MGGNARRQDRSSGRDDVADFPMPADDDPRSVDRPVTERTGAFVARVWHDEGGLRARVRHTVDLPEPEEVATVTGGTEHVVPELVGRFRHWIEEFVAAGDGTEAPDDGSMTGQ
jgi:hypothetical protein